MTQPPEPKGFLATIGVAIAKHVLPPVIAAVRQEIRDNMPAIIEAVVRAVAKTGGELAANGVDRATDMIPGDLDDKIFDPIVNDILGRFGLGR